MHLNHLCGLPLTIQQAVVCFSVAVFVFKVSLALSLPEVFQCCSCVLIGLITSSLMMSEGTYPRPLAAHSVWPAYSVHIILRNFYSLYIELFWIQLLSDYFRPSVMVESIAFFSMSAASRQYFILVQWSSTLSVSVLFRSLWHRTMHSLL